MLVLGIESSCDETGAALVRDGHLILSDVVASQIEIHNRYGGVVPEVASRQQLAAVLPVIESALEQAHCAWQEIDAVAATYGPGLAGSLLVGLTVGKTLAMVYDLPFLGVNHLEAHIYANWLREASDEDEPRFPLLCLVISGAHSELVLMSAHGQYELLGQTRDDAAGEAFDKVARILGLAYPGGPSIQHAAQQAEEALRQTGQSPTVARKAYPLPRAWLRNTYDFSFSGLKTAVLHLAEGATTTELATETASTAGGSQKQISRYTQMGLAARQQGIDIPMLAASFQEAVVDVLATKTRLAAQEYQVKQVVLAGGVAANSALRARLQQELRPLNIRLTYPPVAFCTDNAAMIASAAFFHLSRGERHGLDLDVAPGLSLPFSRK